MVRIIYKHWKNGKTLKITGNMPPQLNNENSERLIVQTTQGVYADVIKDTIISIKNVDNT